MQGIAGVLAGVYLPDKLSRGICSGNARLYAGVFAGVTQSDKTSRGIFRGKCQVVSASIKNAGVSAALLIPLPWVGRGVCRGICHPCFMVRVPFNFKVAEWYPT